MPQVVDEQMIAQQKLQLQQRQSQLEVFKNWQMDGRISLITSYEAWSGQIFWQQVASSYFIQFNAPSGQGAMQLAGNPDGVELRLANGDTYKADDATTLLRQETNWDLPINGLWYWIRGLPDPQQSHKVQFDQQGLIKELTQDSWQIQYENYQLYNNHYFPRKIVIQNKDMKVRVVVTDWTIS